MVNYVLFFFVLMKSKIIKIKNKKATYLSNLVIVYPQEILSISYL